MRISDWSSDVCSSDLNYCQGHLEFNNYGRDHHPRAFSMWMAGGGIKPGLVYGETDEFGYNIVKDPVHIHDFHATILHQLGLNHERLTYKHLGRRYRLRSEEHTSELQSLMRISYAVFCLKKKKL